MGSVKEDIAKLDYMWRYCGVPDEYEYGWEEETDSIKSNCREFATQIISLVCKRIEGAKLKNEELDHILLTEDDLKEIEQMATIGVEPDDHIAYVQNFQMAYDDKLKRKTAQAQLQHSIDAIKEE